MPSGPSISTARVPSPQPQEPRSDVRTTWRADLPDELADVDWIIEGVDMWGEPSAAPPPESVLHRLSRIRSAGSIRPSTAPGPGGAPTTSGRSLLRRSREDMQSGGGAGESWTGNYVPYPGAAMGSWKGVQVLVRKRGREVMLEVVDPQAPAHPVRTLLMHMMHATDLRPIHRSLFQRPHVVSLHSHPQSLPPSSSSSPLSSTSLQPVYIAFTYLAPMESFLSLFHCLSKPDVRGQHLAKDHGGLWRMFRRVSVQLLEVAQAEKDKSSGGTEGETQVLLSVNHDPCALFTSPFPSPATAQLPDLPRIEHLELLIFTRPAAGISPKKEKEKAQDQAKERVCVGRVELPATMWRNRWVEERWMFEGGGGGVRARVKVDEVQVLPWTEYAPVHEYLSHPQTSLPDLFLRLKQLPGLSCITEDHLGSLGAASGKIWRDLSRSVRAEVAACTPAHTGALFRSNNGLLGAVSAAFRAVGMTWLDEAVGGTVRQVMRERAAVAGGRELGKDDAGRVMRLAETLWAGIVRTEKGCPAEIRHFLSVVRTSVSTKFGDTQPLLDLKIVAFFVLFAFLLKGFGSPVQFGLIDGPVEDGVREMLVLLGKMVHGLSLFNSQFKEEKLQPLNSFLSTHRESATAFLTAISTPAAKPAPYSPNLSLTGESIATLETRLPPLHGQSIPIPTRPRDLPREYALFAASITAAARDRMSDPPSTPSASATPHRPATAGSVTGPSVAPSKSAVPAEWETLKSRCLAVQRQIDARLRKVAKESRRGNSAGGRATSSNGRVSTPSDRPPKSPGGYHLPTRLGGGGYDENVPPGQSRPSAEDRDVALAKLAIPGASQEQQHEQQHQQTLPPVSLAREGGVLMPIENHQSLGVGHPPLQRLFIPSSDKQAQRPPQGDVLARPGSRSREREADEDVPDVAKTPRRRYKTEPIGLLNRSAPTSPVKATAPGSYRFIGLESASADGHTPADLSLPDLEVKKRPSKGFLSRLTGRG